MPKDMSQSDLQNGISLQGLKPVSEFIRIQKLLLGQKMGLKIAFPQINYRSFFIVILFQNEPTPRVRIKVEADESDSEIIECSDELAVDEGNEENGEEEEEQEMEEEEDDDDEGNDEDENGEKDDEDEQMDDDCEEEESEEEDEKKLKPKRKAKR